MTEAIEGQMMYDKKMLDELDFSKFESKFSPVITISNPGEGLRIRPLQCSDFSAGYIDLLGQLTSTGDISNEEFIDRFESMRSCPNTYYITVVEDITTGRIVGSASLVLEQKFIHKCALRGRVEDVVVSDQYRGRQLGKVLMATMVLLAEHLGVYKLTLDCRDHMVPFYQSFGYNKEHGNSNYMQIRFKS